MRKQGLIRATADVTVAFHDVDLAGVVWHGHYLKYLENARWALMGKIDFTLDDMVASGYLWPIVGLEVKYVRAARFGDQLRIQASLVEWEARLAVNYLVIDRKDDGRVARARTVQVAVDKNGTLQFAMPPCLTDRVSATLGALEP